MRAWPKENPNRLGRPLFRPGVGPSRRREGRRSRASGSTLTPNAPFPSALFCLPPRPRGAGATPPLVPRAGARRPPLPFSSPSARGRARPDGPSCRSSTNPQGLVPAGSHVSSEGLEVGVLITTYGGLVGGRLVLV